MNFLHNPSWSEDLPDAVVVDSPERLNESGTTIAWGGAWIQAPNNRNKPNERTTGCMWISAFDYTRRTTSKRAKNQQAGQIAEQPSRLASSMARRCYDRHTPADGGQSRNSYGAWSSQSRRPRHCSPWTFWCNGCGRSWKCPRSRWSWVKPGNV